MTVQSRSDVASTGRSALVAAMRDRPADPWPRGVGHVVYARPGSSEEEKAYYEPGGSFSPAFATFGIGIWVLTREGRRVATSDDIPARDVEQRFERSSAETLPRLTFRTPYYVGAWSAAGSHGWRLDVEPTSEELDLALVVRGAGPAGGPLTRLERRAGSLVVNGRWALHGPSNYRSIEWGREARGIWQSVRDREVIDPDGWAYAICALDRGPTTVELQPLSKPAHPTTHEYASEVSPLTVDLPDARFTDSLFSQIEHLRMGLVRDETRPGDPNNYPVNWLRDGAYTIVALARAGYLETARTLCGPFAAQDFFGGFGSEADAPGLALWALGTVAELTADPSLDEALWRAVRRKAELLVEMSRSTGELRFPHAGPVVPAYAGHGDLDLVCRASRAGLVDGMMDWQWPVMFINAVTYTGLRSAAAFAQRQARPDLSARWSDLARDIQSAWNARLAGGGDSNERTLVCGLHPSGIVTRHDAYRDLLSRDRATTHRHEALLATPLWTYFTVAKAHQWLLLGELEPVWADLHWFWDHQASDGLYTWWEGSGEENTFHRWERARGWVDPPHVTPHYWTAAEMLLLQLSMLAYVDASQPDSPLVVGAGLSPSWLGATLSVDGLATRYGNVGWTLEGDVLTVRTDLPTRVELGAGLPTGTTVRHLVGRTLTPDPPNLPV